MKTKYLVIVNGQHYPIETETKQEAIAKSLPQWWCKGITKYQIHIKKNKFRECFCFNCLSLQKHSFSILEGVFQMECSYCHHQIGLSEELLSFLKDLS